ncbi:MAG: apolipoprotein N-acyltransferase [Parcubacteria group bacterium]|nr:apolipoprotein N-acyltransferase [Parcubacteria group bacterium]
MKLKGYKPYLLIIVASVCLWLSYPPFSFNFLLPIGIFSFLWLICSSLPGKLKFLLGSVGGSLYFFLFMKWWWALYPLSWAGVDNKFIGAFVVMLIWIVSAVSGGIFWGLWVLVTSFLTNKSLNNLKFKNTLFLSLLVGSVFILMEYTRSWFFSLVWLGQGTYWGGNWTWGNLAYDFSNNFVVNYLSSLGGVYLVEFIVIFLIALCFFCIRIQGQIRKIGLMGLFVLSVVFYLPNFVKFNTELPEVAHPPVEIAVIQTKMPSDINLSSKIRIDEFKLELSLLHEAAKLNPTPQIIVFPEGTNFFSNLSSILDKAQLSNFLSGLFKERTLIVDNDVVFENGVRKSKVLFVDTKEGLVGFYDKQFLTPGGEFMPYWFELLFKVLAKDKLSGFIAQRSFQSGVLSPPVVNLEVANRVKTSAVVCSGLFSPGLLRELSSKEPDFIIVLASTGIFKGANDLIDQNIAIAQIRAIENRKPIILSANFGISYIIDFQGKVIKSTKNQEPQLFTGTVVPNSAKTLYNKLGDWPLILALIFGFFALRFRRSLKSKR